MKNSVRQMFGGGGGDGDGGGRGGDVGERWHQ